MNIRLKVGLCVIALAGSLLTVAMPDSSSLPAAADAAPACPGYGVLLAKSDGSVTVDAPNSASCAASLNQGSLSGKKLNAPIIGITALPNGAGYWLLAADGGVFTFGQARFFGSTGALKLNAPIVGMAATPDGGGYWLVGSDGGVFAFGDARFFGSTGSLHLNKPVVGMATDAATGGYWLVAADGGVFAFNAPFFGSMGGKPLNAPIRFVTGTPDFGGYRMVASDGGVFDFGDAVFFGSAAAPGSSGWSALAPTPDGAGYWLFAANGANVAFGDASSANLGAVAGATATGSVVAAATVLIVPSAADGFLQGIACATVSDCVAVGGTQAGGALIEDSINGGSNFTTDAVPSGAPVMNAVECSDATHCIAVGAGSAMISDDGGFSWTLVTTPGNSLTGVACENDQECLAVGGTDGTENYISTSDGGTSWNRVSQTLPTSFAAACLSSACVAAGEAITRSTDGGMSWQSLGINGGTQGYLGLSCIMVTSSCLAVGPNPGGISQPTDPGGLGISNDNGQTWTNEASNLPASTASLMIISCSGSTDCVALGPNPSKGAALVVASTTDLGVTWKSFSGPTGVIIPGLANYPGLGMAVTCTAAASCVFVGASNSGPVAYTTTDGGQQWTSDSVPQT